MSDPKTSWLLDQKQESLYPFPQSRGAIVLCGGQSIRMGRDKASLLFGPDETLLQRVVRILSECVSLECIVCVAAAAQELPKLPRGMQIVTDREPNGGPLVALATGLSALGDRVEVAYVCGCDAPLLQPAFVLQMFALLGGCQIAAPHDGERWHPLAGVYRTEIADRIHELSSSGKRSLHELLNACNTLRVALAELRGIDPGLLSLSTCNTPAEYQAALSKAGYGPPAIPNP